MIDKFKSFFQKRKKEKNKFDPEYTKNVISDIILSLDDIKGVTISKSNIVTQDRFDLFKVKYHFNWTNNTDIEEFKNEILNCKSHIESEDLIINVSLSKNNSGTISIYTQESFKFFRNNKLPNGGTFDKFEFDDIG
jgi:hypothetical protein